MISWITVVAISRPTLIKIESRISMEKSKSVSGQLSIFLDNSITSEEHWGVTKW